MTEWTRLQELEDFRATLSKLEAYLGGVGPKEPINIVDPEQCLSAFGNPDNHLPEFGHRLEDVLVWVKSEIESEELKENEALPDEGRDVMWRVGQ